MPVKNILVVDDSPTERFFTVDVLTKAGYQVTTAENGEEGIAKARASKKQSSVFFMTFLLSNRCNAP